MIVFKIYPPNPYKWKLNRCCVLLRCFAWVGDQFSIGTPDNGFSVPLSFYTSIVVLNLQEFKKKILPLTVVVDNSFVTISFVSSMGS